MKAGRKACFFAHKKKSRQKAASTTPPNNIVLKRNMNDFAETLFFTRIARVHTYTVT